MEYFFAHHHRHLFPQRQRATAIRWTFIGLASKTRCVWRVHGHSSHDAMFVLSRKTTSLTCARQGLSKTAVLYAASMLTSASGVFQCWMGLATMRPTRPAMRILAKAKMK